MTNEANSSKGRDGCSRPPEDVLNDGLREAIRHMVANISKSFIVEWYTSISPTNHDFVACCDTLIEDALTRLAELIVKRLDKYKIGQLVSSLLHDHVLNESSPEKKQSIEHQIDNFEYDICQSSVIRLFGLLCTDKIRHVIFTDNSTTNRDLEKRNSQHGSPRKQQQKSRPTTTVHETSLEETKTTSALYTLVIAMLTKAVFMSIVDSISEPNWLYAVIIWLCKKEERDQAKKEADQGESQELGNNNQMRKYSRPTNNLGTAINPSTSILITRSYRSLDLEEGIDIASANINFENPICDSLKRPLDNIEIYDTEEVKSSSSCYVLYCIRYDGLCHRHPSAGAFSFIPEQHDIPIIDKRETNRRPSNNNRPGTSSAIYEPPPPNRKSFRRSMTIKRRFREFVILQLRLEENPKIRPYMKNIPKPTKLKAATQNIFSLPGITNIKLDQSTIRLRQRFLERFLNALNSSPFIANSYEFKEFFSYNVNPAGTTISKSKSLILQVNLNKVLVDGVRSAFSIIRSTLPASSDDQGLSSNPDPDAWLWELQQSTMKLHVQTRTSHSKMSLERYIDSKLISLSDRPNRSCKLSTTSMFRPHIDSSPYQTSGFRGGSLRPNMLRGYSTSSTSSSQQFPSRSSSSTSPNVDSSSRSSSIESIYHDAFYSLDSENTNDCKSIQICDSVPIASKFIDIVHYSITRNSSCNKSPINFLTRLLFGKTIERYVIRLLEAAFTLNIATFCINGITSSIWEESDDPPLDLENASLDEAVSHLTRLLERNYASHTFIPKQFMHKLISKQIRFYLSQLASQKRNKFVIYAFFVHLLDELEIVEQSQ